MYRKSGLAEDLSPSQGGIYSMDLDTQWWTRKSHMNYCIYSTARWGFFLTFGTYVVWQKSNETGNTVHKLTVLLPPPSHGS